MPTREYAILDVFTDVPLRGNPLAVFGEGDRLSGELMQRTARELNLSETAFLLAGDADSDAAVRIFTPATELPFAGHPVLGAACFLGERLDAPLVRLRTAAGIVPVTLRGRREETSYGEMEQPIPTHVDFEPESELLSALGVERAALPVKAYRNGPVHVYVALASANSVTSLRPDLLALAALGPLGVSCFAALGANRFKTRMFAPGLGVSEDPATGSAAGPLAVHLAAQGQIEYGTRIEIFQGEEIARPSTLHASVEGSPQRIERVTVGGSAVVVARGRYRLG